MTDKQLLSGGQPFSQAALLPLLVLSTSGRGWMADLLHYLYLDCLTSPFPSLRFLSQLLLLLSFAPNPPGQIRTVESH